MSIEAMKKGLDALGYVMSHGARVQTAKDILTQAIEQAEQAHAIDTSKERVDETAKGEQEPVAWVSDSPTNGKLLHRTKADAWRWSSNITPLYSAPPKREWVGLTDEEIEDLIYLYQKIDASNSPYFYRRGFARAIEVKLREKNKW